MPPLFRDTNAGRGFRGRNASEDFTVIQSTNTVLVSGSSGTPVTVKDASINNFTSAVTKVTTNLQAKIILGGWAKGPAAFTSDNPAILTVDNQGVVTYVSAGNANVTVKVPGIAEAKKYNIAAQLLGGQTAPIFNGFAAGSLGKHLNDAVAGLLSGLTLPNLSGTPPFAYSSLINIASADGQSRNTGGWWGNTDLTCIPWSGTHGVLITPRDLITAWHLGLPAIGGVFYFKDNNNVNYTATIAAVSPTGTAQLSGTTSDGNDLRVITFTADLPSAIKPALMLPSTFRNYLPQPQYGYPLMFGTQDSTLLCCDSLSFDAGSPSFFVAPSDTTRKSAYYAVRGGDSGHPAFMRINGSLAVFTQWHFAGGGIEGGPIDTDNTTPINAALAANGSPYSVATVNLSAFNTY